jgi:hypothetical protein
MRKACAAVVVALLAVSGCGGSGDSGAAAKAVCKDMLEELTTLQTVSGDIQAGKYGTPAAAVNDLAAVGKRIAATTRDATTAKADDLGVPFGAMLIAVQEFQTNVATQDAGKEAQVQAELQQGDAGVRAACAKH